MRIAYLNLIDDADLTPNVENPLLPVENIQDSHLGRVWRTTGLTTTAQIVIDLGSAQDISCIGLAGLNITDDATITIEANSSDSWGAPPFSTTLDVAETMLKFIPTQTYRYWRVTIADPTNPDFYVEVGRVYLGQYMQMPGIVPGTRIPRQTSSAIDIAPSGAVFGDLGRQFRSAEFSFAGVSNAKRAEIDAMFAVVDRVTPVFIAIWANELTYEMPIYAVIGQDRLDWAKDPGKETFSASMTITEVE
jgi:hypothetical protein